jgi:hypothetical protein
MYGHIGSTSNVFVDPNGLMVSTTCPFPLVIPKNPQEVRLFGGTCQLPCNYRYSSAEHLSIEVVSIILIGLSLIFSGILSLTFVIFRSQRHKKIILFYTLSYFLATLMIFIGLMHRSGDKSLYYSQCENNVHLQHMQGFALFQSLLLVYFLIASSCWWCMNCIDLFQKLILGESYRRGTIEYKQKHLAFHIFSWGVPLICVGGMLVGNQLGFDGFLPFSFIAQDDQMVSKAIGLSWCFVFAPILFLTVVGFSLVGIIFFFLLQYDPTGGLKKYQDEMQQLGTSAWFKVSQSAKLFGFVFLMVSMFWFFFFILSFSL